MDVLSFADELEDRRKENNGSGAAAGMTSSHGLISKGSLFMAPSAPSSLATTVRQRKGRQRAT